ncbi:uncharacterized protein LOC117115417 [Anneissia japonica]|uniref:uncharacterized protein LOC117115417 n=1 Tax=Anneissia japonica TaxID=1529436 RepID=UPI001425635D|nr:uncharacterized protein LOC117115417 [Anneissia japonica]
MSRSVKDLRDLVCISRLTVRESDDELSEDESLIRPFSSMSILSDGTTKSREIKHEPDSPKVPKPPSTSKRPKHEPSKHRRSENIQKNATNSVVKTVISCNHVGSNDSIDFKSVRKPLPPLKTSRPSSSSSDETRPISSGNFDGILTFMDETCVESFLKRANEMVIELSSWCHCNNNFVHFADFWLHKVPDRQKLDLYELEVGIITDELMFAFEAGIEQQKVQLSDIRKLVSAVLREYPTRLCTLRGPYLFLDILDTLSSDKTDAYRELLTDVKISTRNRKFAQWMLATRAFALLNVWSAVVSFYRRLINDPMGATAKSPPVEVRSKDSAIQRAFVATGLGYVHFLHYYFKTSKVSPNVVDTQKRSLVFEAVTCNQETTLLYLLTKTKPRPDVNKPADSGNVALHTAANTGNVQFVRMLLDKGGADVNCRNVKCDGATPLHLGVMQGHNEVCQVLLEAGADIQASMDGVTPLDLAQDLGHTTISEAISKMADSQSQSGSPMEVEES